MLVSSACSSASESWDGRLLSFPFVAVLVQLVLSPAFVNLYLCWWRDSLKRPLWPDSRRLTLLVSLRTGAGADALSVHVARVHHILPAEVILSPNSLLEARRCAVGSFRGAPPPLFSFFLLHLAITSALLVYGCSCNGRNDASHTECKCGPEMSQLDGLIFSSVVRTLKLNTKCSPVLSLSGQFNCAAFEAAGDRSCSLVRGARGCVGFPILTVEILLDPTGFSFELRPSPDWRELSSELRSDSLTSIFFFDEVQRFGLCISRYFCGWEVAG